MMMVAVRVLMIVIHVGADAAALHEDTGTVGIELFLPDRHPVLDLVDGPAARGKRFRAMRGARDAIDRDVADLEQADAVHDADVRRAEPVPRRLLDLGHP